MQRRAGSAIALLLVGFLLGVVTTRGFLSPGASPCREDDDARVWSRDAFGSRDAYASSPSFLPGPPPGPPGAFSFTDARGTYERRSFPIEDDDAAAGSGSAADAERLYVNVAYTRAGYARSGDAHPCHQVNVLNAGSARLTLAADEADAGAAEEGERSRLLRPGDVVVIPPFRPHLYEFLEDSVLTESWVFAPDGPSGKRTQCAFEAKLFKPLRDRIPEGHLVRSDRDNQPTRDDDSGKDHSGYEPVSSL